MSRLLVKEPGQQKYNFEYYQNTNIKYFLIGRSQNRGVYNSFDHVETGNTVEVSPNDRVCDYSNYTEGSHSCKSIIGVAILVVKTVGHCPVEYTKTEEL